MNDAVKPPSPTLAPALTFPILASSGVPRQGAFADTVRMLYAKRYSTSEPEIEVFGKPTTSTFDYAKEVLERRSGEVRHWGSGERPLERVYMIGGENVHR